MTWISCFCRQHIDLLLSFEHGLLQRVVAKYISKHHDKLVRERRTESGERRRKDDDVRGCFLICPHVQTRLSIVTAASPGVVQTPIISLVFCLIDYSLFSSLLFGKEADDDDDEDEEEEKEKSEHGEWKKQQKTKESNDCRLIIFFCFFF